ncbi:CLUMA_CG021437, isoform A [Clunio marinus]|uniref:CLUMA_CG021437, isoform A n=1 Tax=Clunio marinus TaxID=568069 RepID=A0A1J1J9E8_9DIPT|nr:CLUMA_CG021437, isoform A [Clunio marinus]
MNPLQRVALKKKASRRMNKRNEKKLSQRLNLKKSWYEQLWVDQVKRKGNQQHACDYVDMYLQSLLQPSFEIARKGQQELKKEKKANHGARNIK